MSTAVFWESEEHRWIRELLYGAGDKGGGWMRFYFVFKKWKPNYIHIATSITFTKH